MISSIVTSVKPLRLKEPPGAVDDAFRGSAVLCLGEYGIGRVPMSESTLGGTPQKMFLNILCYPSHSPHRFGPQEVHGARMGIEFDRSDGRSPP